MPCEECKGLPQAGGHEIGSKAKEDLALKVRPKMRVFFLIQRVVCNRLVTEPPVNLKSM